jgi:hypothetical protein
LAPLLFNLGIEALQVKVEKGKANTGIEMDGVKLNISLFADDALFYFKDEADFGRI